MEVRQYTLQVLSGSEAVSLLTPFVPFEDGGGVWRSSGTVISVVGNKRTLAIADSVLKSYDHPPVTLVLRFMLIEATDSAITDPRIGEVDGELRRLLKFNGYRRLAEATSVVAETQNFTSTMASADRTEFTVDGGVKNVRDGRVGIGIALRSGTKGMMMGVPTSPDTRPLLSTTLTVPLGQTVVLGTAAGDKGVVALILTVRPELAAEHPAAPAVGIAASSTSAAKAVRNLAKGDTGTFAFSVHYGSETFDGILHAFGDSVTVESPNAQCRPRTYGSRPSGFGGNFICPGIFMLDDFTLSFSIPKGPSYWSGSYTKEQPGRPECIQYSVDNQGKRFCAEWQTKMVDVTVRVGDKILVEPAPAVGITSSSTAPQSSERTYEFKVHSGSASFDGILRVLGDSMEVESQHGYCVAELGQSSSEVKHFKCGGLLGVENLVLAFDVQNVRDRSHWWGTVNEEQTNGPQCVQYLGSVCVAWRPTVGSFKKSVGDRIVLTPKPLSGA